MMSTNLFGPQIDMKKIIGKKRKPSITSIINAKQNNIEQPTTVSELITPYKKSNIIYFFMF